MSTVCFVSYCEGCFEISHPLSCCTWNEMTNTHFPSKLKNSLLLQKSDNPPPPLQNNQTIFLLTFYGDNTCLLFCFQGTESTVWMPFMSHHYVVDCGEKGMEKWEAERQSCSLMACKVISCGLVKLKAASLGCNSWQSCPPFTLANPSFRAFSHNQRFMERGRKRGL